MSWLSSLFGGSSSRISGERARELVADGAQLLDVRSPAEFSGRHLDGAVNIPVQELSGRVSELESDRVVVLYCASGARSARAAGLLKGQGFDEVYDLGGIGRW